ncbi:MAG: dUTP diphosphatase [Patescibacteria group bacterium]|jgi:dUTP pyrophosphatase
MINLEISRIDPTLPLPTYATPGSVAFDIYAREETAIAPAKLALIPSNLIVRVPEGYVLLLASRSSTPLKKGLLTPHGIGIVDQDFCGPTDEMKVQVYNFTAAEVVIKRGERIAQALVLPVAKCDLVEVEMTGASRGGYGSTGS